MPFMCVGVDIKNIPDEVCEKFSPRLVAFICALKYVRNIENHREMLKGGVDRIIADLPEPERLDPLKFIDIYLNGLNLSVRLNR